MWIDKLTHTNNVLSEILDERLRQDKKWGEQNYDPGTHKVWKHLADTAKQVCDENVKKKELTWLNILVEEIYEACAEEDVESLRIELIQVAAVACAFIESLDRNELKGKHGQFPKTNP